MARPSALDGHTPSVNTRGIVLERRVGIASVHTIPRGSTPEAGVSSSVYSTARTNEINEVEYETETEHERFVLTTQTHMLLPLIETGT